MKRNHIEIGNELYLTANKKCKAFFYDFALERATVIEKNRNIEDLQYFLSSLSETFIKVRIDYIPKNNCFTFVINDKPFSTATRQAIHTYDHHDQDFYNFIDKLSNILVEPVSEFCDSLLLKTIPDPSNIISASYYTAHFLASLTGYKFI